ncbi:glycosyltransferase family 1 protein [Marinobacter salinexigens]|uniref:glycosyltransferase family 1 protein n=1 Tax=Marinobacter salinexigens TaxID=2919747 RepID=UPI00165F89EE|nr:glycosyltransferase family 1 protein [Marinobacter salinexigens]
MPVPVFVVQQCPNPSTEFFVAPALSEAGESVQAFTFNETPAPEDLMGSTVVFVRYVPSAWKALLKKHPAGRVVFFMDDDLFDLHAFRGMPWHYQRKLFRLAWRHQSWLRSVGAEVWVSSPWLAQKYANWAPRVFEPSNPHKLRSSLGEPLPAPVMQTVFYHGSASHRAELEWLVPVVEQLLAVRDDVCFEVMGDRKVRDRFAHLPRVHVVHPMSWPAYKAFIQRPGRTVGLAPLLDSAFNAARAPTKFYDITAAGAVGVYADTPVYRRLISHQKNGLLLPMDEPGVWVEEVLNLLSSPGVCSELLLHSLASIDQ